MLLQGNEITEIHSPLTLSLAGLPLTSLLSVTHSDHRSHHSSLSLPQAYTPFHQMMKQFGQVVVNSQEKTFFSPSYSTPHTKLKKTLIHQIHLISNNQLSRMRGR